MGKKMFINTTMVKKSAAKIQQINNRIRDDFNDVEVAMKKLDSSWNSRAGDAVIGKFYQLKNQYNNARYQVIHDVYRFMMNHVSDGYQVTEEENTSLADAFK